MYHSKEGESMKYQFLGDSEILDYLNKEFPEGKGFDFDLKHPVVANPGEDVGIDLFAPYSFAVQPHAYRNVNSFVKFEFPYGVYGMVKPRGRDNFLTGSGVVDTGYTGPIIVKIVNYTDKVMSFEIGDSLGQLALSLAAYKATDVRYSPLDVLGDGFKRREKGSIVGDSASTAKQPQPFSVGTPVDVPSLVQRDLVEMGELSEMLGGDMGVIDDLVLDISQRADEGEKKYGVRLHTNNGRNALWDLYQELLDAVQYCRQLISETED